MILPQMILRLRVKLSLWILLSTAIMLLSGWFLSGLEITSFSTQDSAGRTMGFNDQFSPEHYAIICQKAEWRRVPEKLGVSGLALLFAQGIMLGLIAGGSRRSVRTWAAVQGALFFLGWPGMVFLPLAVLDFLWMHTSDREGFTDIPWGAMMGQGAWLYVCLGIVIALRVRKMPRESAIQSENQVII